MRRARFVIVLAVAAVGAIGLAVAVRTATSGKSTSQAAAAIPVEKPKPMARVLVAKHDLKVGARIGPEDLDWQEWPVSAVNPAFVTDGSATPPAPVVAKADGKSDGKADGKADAAAGKAVGTLAGAGKPADGAVDKLTKTVAMLGDGGPKARFLGAVVREPILAGEPIVDRKVVKAGDGGFLAVVLPAGMRAMAVKVTVESAAGGFILPNDHVDVILSRQMPGGAGGGPKFLSETVLRNVKVLAVDQSTQPEKGENSVVGATATLAVNPADAEALALAKSQGDLSLVLRSYADLNGPSGRTPGSDRVASATAAAAVTTVRVFRNGEASSVPVM
jgi:pilus assembly protein CpaB